MRPLIVTVMATLVTGCVSAPPGVPPTISDATVVMTTQQLNATFASSVVEGDVVGGKFVGTHWREISHPDGTLEFSADNGFSDTGRFENRDNQSCSTHTKLNSGKETCYRTVDLGNNRYASYLPSGVISSIYHLAK